MGKLSTTTSMVFLDIWGANQNASQAVHNIMAADESFFSETIASANDANNIKTPDGNNYSFVSRLYSNGGKDLSWNDFACLVVDLDQEGSFEDQINEQLKMVDGRPKVLVLVGYATYCHEDKTLQEYATKNNLPLLWLTKEADETQKQAFKSSIVKMMSKAWDDEKKIDDRYTTFLNLAWRVFPGSNNKNYQAILKAMNEIQEVVGESSNMPTEAEQEDRMRTQKLVQDNIQKIQKIIEPYSQLTYYFKLFLTAVASATAGAVLGAVIAAAVTGLNPVAIALGAVSGALVTTLPASIFVAHRFFGKQAQRDLLNAEFNDYKNLVNPVVGA